MQSFSYHKKLSVVLLFCLAANTVQPVDKPAVKPLFETSKATRALGTTVLLTVLVSYLRLVTKKTQPKRVQPKDDSLKELIWYLFDEILVGQMEKGERPDKLVVNADNPGELVYKYSKIEARGAAGILYSALKPIIIPALTLMVLLDRNSKDVYCSINGMLEFATNPFEYIADLNAKCQKDPSALKSNASGS